MPLTQALACQSAPEPNSTSDLRGGGNVPTTDSSSSFIRRPFASLDAIDRRSLHIDDGVTRGGSMPDKMLEQAGQRREATAYGRSCRALLLALHPLPRNHGA